MKAPDPVLTPRGHTPDGGVVVGNADSKKGMVLFEDPQCPYCRQFEELNGPVITDALEAGLLAVEYRMRCFLGPESVRADNALALAAELSRFDELRRALRRTASRGNRRFRNRGSPGSGCTGRTDRFGLRFGSSRGAIRAVGPKARDRLPGTGSAGNTCGLARWQPDGPQCALRPACVRVPASGLRVAPTSAPSRTRQRSEGVARGHLVDREPAGTRALPRKPCVMP